MKSKSILQVNQLHKAYSKEVAALRNINFEVDTGECVGIVGESGSGKSTLARAILCLEEIDQGSIIFNKEPLHLIKGKRLREIRKHIQVIFQDPTASLNPKLPVLKSVLEPLNNYPDVVPSFLADVITSRRKTIERLFEMVGLSRELLERYPHQLSGGQRQRVAIARGISLQPQLLICDEPTACLDMSVHGEILNLLLRFKEELDLSLVFISHDIPSVRYISDRVIVLKDGRIVDQFKAEQLHDAMRHPYTKLLIEASELDG